MFKSKQGYKNRRAISMVLDEGSVFGQLVKAAVDSGANAIDVEYKDGYEEVFAMTGGKEFGIGFDIARFRSSSHQATSLRRELYSLAKRKQRIAIGGTQYELRARIYDSFGEDAFHVELRRV